MKKSLIAITLSALVASVLIVPTAQASTPVICLAYDTGGPGDGSFNDAAQAGLKVAAKKFQFTLETTVTAGDAKDRIDRLTALVKKDCTIVIAVGTGYAATLKDLSQQFPETQFAILNDATVDALNVTSIVFADVQGAYLAGYAAALARIHYEAPVWLTFVVAVLAAAILSSGLTLGLYKVGGGLAARAGNAITVTGTASEDAKADNAVWSLNLNESQSTLATSVKKIDSSAEALKKYLLNGGVSADQIELGPINSNAVMEYSNGNPTGRILAYQAYRTVTVRTKDVELVSKLSNDIGTLLATGVNVGNYGPAYYLSTLDQMRAKLLAAAMQDAKERAKAITEAVGGEVGPLLSVSTGPTQVTTRDSLDRSAGGFYDVSTIDKTVNVTLSASFKTN